MSFVFFSFSSLIILVSLSSVCNKLTTYFWLARLCSKIRFASCSCFSLSSLCVNSYPNFLFLSSKPEIFRTYWLLFKSSLELDYYCSFYLNCSNSCYIALMRCSCFFYKPSYCCCSVSYFFADSCNCCTYLSTCNFTLEVVCWLLLWAYSSYSFDSCSSFEVSIDFFNCSVRERTIYY